MKARVSRWWVRGAVLGAVASWTLGAQAAPNEIRLWPVRVLPVPEGTPADLAPLGDELAGVLSEAVRDFGLEPSAAEAEPNPIDEFGRLGAPLASFRLASELALRDGELWLKLALVPPDSRLVLVRAERLAPAELEVKTLGMLRELLEARPGAASSDCPPPARVTTQDAALPEATPGRSEGRAVLALHTAALGGYLGYALQRTSGSNDARLTYPLAALGAGVGVGAAMIVAEEWNIDVAQAWFLGAGMLWPTVATLLILEPDATETPGQRQMLGLVGAIGGVTLATAGLVIGDVTEGGAALTHSGAALGALLGSVTEMLVEGDADTSPREGIGWGALSGVILAGAAATQIEAPSATDMLFIDLRALLGGLLGAAVGTPVLVSQDPSPARDRIWLSGIAAGTLTGAAVSYWVTQSDEPRPPAPPDGAPSGKLRIAPRLGWMGMPLGLGVVGQW